jgi:hypothetical protein
MCRLKKTKRLFMGLTFVFVLCSVLMPAGAGANIGDGQRLQITTNVAVIGQPNIGGIGQAANIKAVANIALSREQLQEIETAVLATQQYMMLQQQIIQHSTLNSTSLLLIVVPVR